MHKIILLLLAIFAIEKLSAQQTILVPYGSSWKYLDNGTNQGTTWRSASFNDAAWASGNAQLGYGDGDEATVVSYGSSSSSKFITTYFRKTISIANASQNSGYALSIKRDDGVVVYVNGAEVYRNNLPSGTISNTTLASAAASDDGATAQTASIPATAFVTGNNVIAVEIHQNAASSTDLSFDLQLTASVSSPSNNGIAYNSSWKYLANGSNQGTAWRASSFNDASWTTGNAQLGYGDGDEATVISYGSNANNKYRTTYFRKTVSINSPSSFANFTLNLKRDDGAVVYINGTERFRSNMPSGTISYTTLASSAASDDGNTAQSVTLASSNFVNGNNTIAVEIHQNDVTSTDLSFDLQLMANGTTPPATATLTRGPYLQMGNQTAVTLRWRTNVATNSRLEVGTVHGTYPTVVNDAASVTEHEIRISGLTPDTKYFYRFGSSTASLQSGTDNYFVTAPPATTLRKTRFAVFGDCGRNDNGFRTGSLNSYLSYTVNNPGEALLLLGDNAYNNGTDAEYQSNFFNPLSPTILKNHILFPSPGNHDYPTGTQGQRNTTYYQSFTMPTAAQCGGVASGSEAFYSWDWGNVHFLSLDSYGTENPNATRLYDTLGPQVTWVKQDIAANNKKWIVAYWHHPPYTMGSHSSDTDAESINIRQRFIRILERLGVDLILCGHSHNYERSYLLSGHYGNEASFSASLHAKSNSSAKYDGSINSCPYILNSNQPNKGTVYVVAGSSGADGGIQSGYPHNALPFAIDDGGMLYLEIEDNRLDAKFIRRTGVIADQFTIMKDVNKTTNITVAPGTATQLAASWPSASSYTWQGSSSSTRSVSITPTVNSTITAKDNLNCLTDVFNITISSGARMIALAETMQTEEERNAALKVQPTLVRKGQQVLLKSGSSETIEAIITDVHGRIIRRYKFSGYQTIETGNLYNGMYFIKLSGKYRKKPQRFVVTD